MASLYSKKKSPFWWIKYREGGKIIERSTGFLRNNFIQTRQAKKLLLERKISEMSGVRLGGNSCFDKWVIAYLDRSYTNRQTFVRMKNSWANLERWLNEKNIAHPQQVKYNDCIEYVGWRVKDGGARNTAISEIKKFGTIMSEAVRLGFVGVNPCVKLGLRKDKPKEKPEITDKEVEKIREGFKAVDEITSERKWPQWMEIAFEIAIHQGCRLRETSVPFHDINFELMTITFNAKGNKRFTTALHPGLKPILEKVCKNGDLVTCQLPPLPSKWFWLFFKSLELDHLCFHCTRVTVITQLARAGVPMSQAMRFVGHASQTIHRIYQRLSVDDLGACLKALQRNPQPQSPDDRASM